MISHMLMILSTVMLAVNKNAWNKVFNISGEEETNLTELAKEIIEMTGGKSKIFFLPQEKAQPQKVKVDISELKALGYSPKVNIKEGVRRMVEFYKSNPRLGKIMLIRVYNFIKILNLVRIKTLKNILDTSILTFHRNILLL